MACIISQDCLNVTAKRIQEDWLKTVLVGLA